MCCECAAEVICCKHEDIYVEFDGKGWTVDWFLKRPLVLKSKINHYRSFLERESRFQERNEGESMKVLSCCDMRMQ